MKKNKRSFDALFKDLVLEEGVNTTDGGALRCTTPKGATRTEEGRLFFLEKQVKSCAFPMLALLKERPLALQAGWR